MQAFLSYAGVYVKGCSIARTDIPSISLSPCHFKMIEKAKNLEKKGLEDVVRPKNGRTRNRLHKNRSLAYTNVEDWSAHGEVISALSRESHCQEDGKAKLDDGMGLQNLVKAWFLAQVDGISSSAGVQVNSLFIGIETLVHLEVISCKSWSHEDIQALSNSVLENMNKTKKLPAEILYALRIPMEPHTCWPVYELVIGEINKGKNNSHGTLLEKLEIGDPVSFISVKENVFEDYMTTDISALSWMGTTTSDIINSRFSSFIQRFDDILCSLL